MSTNNEREAELSKQKKRKSDYLIKLINRSIEGLDNIPEGVAEVLSIRHVIVLALNRNSQHALCDGMVSKGRKKDLVVQLDDGVGVLQRLVDLDAILKIALELVSDFVALHCLGPINIEFVVPEGRDSKRAHTGRTRETE